MKKQLFYIKDYYYTKSEDDIDVSIIPPLQRRKLSPLDKQALTTMFKVYTEDTEEIIFASEHGEVDRLNTLINQYSESAEVSPAQFSASVHNYPVGFFTLFKKLNIPYLALSAGPKSLSAGITSAVLSRHNNVLFTYTDKLSVSCMISKDSGKIKCSLEDIEAEDEFENFIQILEGIKK